jgi:hypothetical protein
MSKIRHNALYGDLLEDVDEYLANHRTTWLYAYGLVRAVRGELQTPIDDLSVKEFAAGALLNAFLKKFQDGHTSEADAVALDTFTASNIRCGEWTIRDDRSLEEDLLLGLFKQTIYRFFNRGPNGHILSSITNILRDADVGPGSSVGSRGTDFYTKLFSGPLTGTSKSLYAIYANYADKVPFWRTAEQLRSDHFGDFNVVRGNRLSFVPKNVDTSRCICTEPLLNMFFQKGAGRILERRLKQFFGIDLATQQECNRDLARIGSMSERFCTIDLSAASDSVSLNMIRETFPADVVDWLELFRSPEVQLPSGDWVELNMISSMGNAYTFPLETIIFASVVSAAYQMKDKFLKKGYSVDCKYNAEDGVFVQTKRLPNFGVFGDDIIVEHEHYRHTVMLLELLGFSVNAEKSFSQGPFRESCGGDYFRGHPVRGVYIKSLRTQASRYVAINRLNEWSALHGIPLRRTIKRLVKSVRYLPVPLDENDDAGIKVPFHMVANLRKDKDTQSVLYRRWVSVQKKIAIKDGALKLPRGARSRIYNGDGLLVAALRGDVRSFRLGSRLGPTTYRTKEAVTHNWDLLPPISGGETPDVGLARLADAIETNLTG